MSKFGIFVLGIVAGGALSALVLKKGRVNMRTAVLERVEAERQSGEATFIEEKNCTLRGFTSGSGVTVDSFLKAKRKDRELEG
jgi:hypothetical protein